MQSLIYTTKTAAALLECDPKTVEKLCRTREIRATKRLRKWYILPDRLVEYIKTGELTQHGEKW